MKKIIYIAVISAVAFWFLGVCFAEHPGTGIGHREHPGTHEEEHPGKKEMLSAKQIIKGIKGHIDKVTKENNGYFPLRDDKDAKDLRLKLIKVHEDKVSYIKKDDTYFACTDFVAEDGTKYDVDFWMKKGLESGDLVVYDTKIHKKEGAPRFIYKDDEIAPVE